MGQHMDAPCVAPSRVTQKIFAVLVERYHRVVLTKSFKLVSFFTFILLKIIRTAGTIDRQPGSGTPRSVLPTRTLVFSEEDNPKTH